MENITIINKENHFKVFYNKEKTELLGTTQEFKLLVYKDKRLFLSTSKGTLKYLNSLVRDNKANENTKDVIKTIEIRITNIKNEIGVIRNAAVIDGHKLPDIIEIDNIIPIVNNTIEHKVKSNSEILQSIIDNDMESFEKKMYEVLTSNSSEIVVPVLKEIVKEHGYKLIKSSK